MKTEYCPCDSDKIYVDCCGRFISHQDHPSTPEALMRSRYTAYHNLNWDYLRETMKSPAADHFDFEVVSDAAKKTKWIKLEIIKSSQNLFKGTVEFIAHYLVDNKKYRLHEISEFNFIDGKWYYVSGMHIKN